MNSFSVEKKRMWLAVIPSILFVSLIWLAFLVDKAHLFTRDFSILGILPRTTRGLWGIVFSPFIHGSFSHLLSNTLPLLILITFLFYFYSKIAIKSFIFLWITSGFLTWIIGRDSYHIGASGLIFSFVFFLFFSGIFRRYIPLVALSLVVAFIYGSTVWSIFPFSEYIDADISWEGHLSGTISGLIVAFVFRKYGPQKPEKEWEEEDNEEDEEKENLDL